jgi:glycosyltransferase involved in cell wall biosynthesis
MTTQQTHAHTMTDGFNTDFANDFVRPPDWRPMRIAVTGGRGVPCNYSGVERICEELFTWFVDRGHHVTLYCRPQVLKDKTATHRGIKLVRTCAPGGKSGETLTHAFTSLLHATLRGDIHDDNKRFDLVSLHTIAPNLFAPIPYLARIPIVTHVHGLDHMRQKWKGLGARVIRLSERTMLRTASEIAVVNPEITDYYRNTFSRDTLLLPNGVHITGDDFETDPNILNTFGLTAQKYIVTVGRLVPEKRLHDTIAAFLRADPDLKLVFIGEGPHTQDYVQQLKSTADADPKRRIVFTGLQAGVALDTLFRSAALYISASELEGNPSSVMECMERCVPAILTDIAGHRPLFAPVKEYDLSFSPGDVDALTERIKYAVQNPQYLNDIAQACRRHVRTQFSWPALAERTERLYLSVVNRQQKYAAQ